MAIIEHILKIKDEASKTLDETAKSSDNAKKSTDELTKATKLAAGAAVAAAVAYSELVKQIVDYKNLIADTATATGFAMETIAGLKLAAEGSGQELGALVAGLRPFAQRLDQAAKGSGEAAGAVKSLGLEITNADGSLRDMDSILREAVSALNDVENPTERAALATGLFGRSAGNLMVALSGSELDAFIAQAEAIGPSLADGAEQAARFQRSVAELDLAVLGLGDHFAQAFGGEGGANGLLEDFTLGLVAAGTFVTSFFDALLDGVMQRMRNVALGIQKIIQSATEFDPATSNTLLREGVSLIGSGIGTATPVGLLASGAVSDAANAAVADARSASVNLFATRARIQGTPVSGPGGGGGGGGGVGAGGAGGGTTPGAWQDSPWSDPVAASVLESTITSAVEPAAQPLANLGAYANFAVDALGVLAGAAVGAARAFGALLTGDAEGAITGALSSAGGLAGSAISGGISLGATALTSAAAAGLTVGTGGLAAPLLAIAPMLGDRIGAAVAGVFEGVAGAVSTVTTLGRTGVGGVREGLQQFEQDFFAGLEAMPEVIRDVLPEFIESFGKRFAEEFPAMSVEIAKAMIDAAPEIGRALVEAQIEFTRNQFTEGGFSPLASAAFTDGPELAPAFERLVRSGEIGGGVTGRTGPIQIINYGGREAAEEISTRLRQFVGSRGANFSLAGR